MGFKNVNAGVDFGQFKDIGKDTVNALKKAVASDNKIDSSEVADIEKAAKSDADDPSLTKYVTLDFTFMLRTNSRAAVSRVKK